VFEYIWQYIFTGNAVYCPAMSSCYCDGYGLCFGGEKKILEWFDIMDDRNKLFAELDSYKKKKEEAEEAGKAFDFTPEVQKRITELSDMIPTLDSKMEELRGAALKRGEDQKNRQLETETYDDTHIWDNIGQR